MNPAPENLLNKLHSDLKNIFNQFELFEKQHNLVREIDKAILNTTSSTEDVFSLIVEKGKELTNSFHQHIVINQQNRFIVLASSDNSKIKAEIPVENSLCGRAFRECNDIIIENVLVEEQYFRFYPETKSEAIILIEQPSEDSSTTKRIVGMLVFERNQVSVPKFSPNF